MKKISVSIIGCGKISLLNELDNFRKKPASHIGAYLKYRNKFEIRGIYDKNLKKVKKYANIFNLPVFVNLQELINANSDIILVAVNYRNNLKIIQNICNNKIKPRILFCEKPISNNINSAKKIYNLTKSNKIIFLINNRRLEPRYILLKKILARVNDNIVHINAKCSSGLHAIGIHMIDLLQFFLGKIVSSKSNTIIDGVKKLKYSNNFDKSDPRTISYFFFQNKTTCNFLNTAKTDYSFFELEIFLKKYKIIVNHAKNFIEIFFMKKKLHSTLSYQLFNSKKIYFEKKVNLFDNISKELINVYKKRNTKYVSNLDGKFGLDAYLVLNKLKNAKKY